MFRLRTEQHVATLNMTFYKCAVKLLFSLPIIFLQIFFNTSAEVGIFEVHKPNTNGKLLLQGWRGVTLQRHLNEGAAG